MFNKLPEKDYMALVVGGSNDTMHRGAVRVKVLGITNDFADDEQPYVYPAITTGIQQVPQVGYYVRVRFLGGDINSGYYYGVSQTPNIAPAEFTENYPDVAVANLGEDGFFYTHNRHTHITEISNPGNNSQLTWDASGFVTYESNVACAQSGMGAKGNTGENVQHVLTEGTIDIFTCMPVGHNRKASGLGQGSEYLAVSHVSQATIDAFHGSAQPVQPAETPAAPQTEADIQTMDIVNTDGEVVMGVPIDRTDKMVKRNGKVAQRILVCHSEGECFPVMAKKFMESTSNAHYLVGRYEGEPETMPSDGKAGLKNTGFYQFIDIEDDAGMFGGSTIGGEKANVDAVVIMLIGDAKQDFTSYQRGIVDKLVEHVRTKFKNPDMPVVTPGDFDTPVASADMSNFSVDGY